MKSMDRVWETLPCIYSGPHTQVREDTQLFFGLDRCPFFVWHLFSWLAWASFYSLVSALAKCCFFSPLLPFLCGGFGCRVLLRRPHHAVIATIFLCAGLRDGSQHCTVCFVFFCGWDMQPIPACLNHTTHYHIFLEMNIRYEAQGVL